MKKIKVSIVEDELTYQQHISKELANSSVIDCVSWHSTAESALEVIPEKEPDIVILDLTLVGSKIDGIQCMLKLRMKSPKIRFLVLTNHIDEKIIFTALLFGAGAYLDKSKIHRELASLIVEFYKGGGPMSPGIASKVIKLFRKPPEVLILLNGLTEREKELLTLLSGGFQYIEIADQLNITVAMVKQHCNRIYRKLHVSNRTEALLMYYKQLNL